MFKAISRDAILADTLDWSAINSGTRNLDGLASVATLWSVSFSRLPGSVSLLDPALVENIDPMGAATPVPAGRHLVVRVRPDAARRVLLTGHMDTVYPIDDPFRRCDWLDDRYLRGPTFSI